MEEKLKVVKKNKDNFFSGTGRRKTSVARVWLYEKSKSPVEGLIINGKLAREYFVVPSSENIYTRPFQVTDTLGKFSASIRVHGGGRESQIVAVSHGIARALVNYNAEFKSALKKEKLVTRDSRMKERKKYGKLGARRGPQWAKR